MLKKYFVCDLLSFAAVNFNFTLSDNKSSGTIDLSWEVLFLVQVENKRNTSHLHQRICARRNVPRGRQMLGMNE